MEEKNKLWSADFVLILVIALLAFIACQGLNNGTPIYLSYAGGNNALAGALILEFSLAAAVSRIAVGRTIDVRSRRSVMVLGAAFLLAGTLGAVVVPVLELHVLFRALQGIGFGAITTAASTAAADIAPAERLGEGLGYYGLGQSLGMAVGPSVAIVLVSFTWHEALFAGMAAISACLVVLALASGYEKHPQRLAKTSAYRAAWEAAQAEKERSDAAVAADGVVGAAGGAAAGAAGGAAEGAASPAGGTAGGRKREKAPFSLSALFEKAALPGALPMIVSCLGYSIIVNFVSKYGVQAGLSAPGMFFVCAAITMTAVRLGGGRLIDRIAPIRLLALPIACGIACFAILACTTSEPLFYVAGALFGLSMGLAFPLFNTVAVKCAPADRRGAASAMYGLANDVGIGVGAVIWGAVIDAVGYTASFWGGLGMLVAAYAAAALVFPRDPR